jgi:hypothetical protein
LNAGGFLAFELKRLETVKELQEQLLDTFEQFNRQQLAHGKQEMEFASEMRVRRTSVPPQPAQRERLRQMLRAFVDAVMSTARERP